MSGLARTAWAGLALALLIPAWHLAAAGTTFIESPSVVLKALPHFLGSADTWSNIGITLVRVLAGLVLGIVAGFIAALVMSRSPFMGEVLGYYVTAALRTPSAIAAILALPSTRSTHSCGRPTSPCTAPSRLPQMEPVESLSPEWLTDSSRAASTSSSTSAQ